VQAAAPFATLRHSFASARAASENSQQLPTFPPNAKAAKNEASLATRDFDFAAAQHLPELLEGLFRYFHATAEDPVAAYLKASNTFKGWRIAVEFRSKTAR
jgi:hypothetical protein